MMKSGTKFQGFTLIEFMIAIVVIGILASVALPKYHKSLLKGHERDAIMQLSALHAMCKVYKAQTNQYLIGTLSTEADINSNLKLNILSNGMAYTYEGTASQFKGRATHSTGFIVYVDERPLEEGVNPCCDRGSGGPACPSLPDCA